MPDHRALATRIFSVLVVLKRAPCLTPVFAVTNRTDALFMSLHPDILDQQVLRRFRDLGFARTYRG